MIRRSLFTTLVWLLLAGSAVAQTRSIIVASTTSTEQSGLFGHILPAFAAATGIEARVVAVGTGQALEIGRRGDADVVFVHDAAAEERFVAEGFARRRVAVMYNDLVLIGPRPDPAQTNGSDSLTAFRRLAEGRVPFISRGDRSGTHAAELRLWADAGVDLATVRGPWYREIGQGMGPALNMASAVDGYVLSDRGTWLAFRNRGALAIVVEGDRRLFNPYSVMVVANRPANKAADAQAFVDWLVSPAGQQRIASYAIGGQQLFFPSAVTD
ncbi:MAG: extracellular solute-binding protein [Gemmatimonadaceae bacterium]|nr:extracellular solute-binding protein [Acetobacteraceae bacterium]